jgi:hypothetical protein
MKRLALVLFIAALAACGGGGGGPSLPSQSFSSPTPAASGQAIQLFPLTNYTQGSPVTTPSPGTLGVNELNLSYTVTGQTQYVLVFEPGFSGTFTFGVPTCTLSPASVTLNLTTAAGPQAVLAITSSSAGSCSVKITDGTTANTAEIDAVVTTTSGTISITKPRH